MITVGMLTLVGCGLFAPDLDFLDAEAPAGAPPPVRDLALARTSDATFQLPATSRPDAAAAPEVFELVGEFEKHKTVDDLDVYRIPLPVPVHLLPNATGGSHLIGSAEPAGFVVTGPDAALAWHFPRARAPYTWGFDHRRLFVGLPAGEPAPRASEFRIQFPRATEAENGRNFALSGLTPEAFVQREVTVGQTSQHGLFLPAPARATFPITVPEAAHLSLSGTILTPAIRHTTESDGARLEVRVEVDGEASALGSLDLRVGETEPADFDLSAFAGRRVDLVIETLPGASPDFDYVFLASPVVASRERKPQRVLAIFVDTLRPDHLGFMGYERDTSPTLDRMARHATVFTEARSVAPWTLPSARAALSGHQPEQWSEVTTLAEHLGALGFRTEGLVTNAFLSAPFDVQRGFDRYRYRHLMPAHDVVADVESIVDAWPDRDLFVLAHFMEPHLPYDEPWSQRFRWAGLRPSGISFVRNSLVEVDTGDESFDAIRQHIVARYDQNIAAFDRAIGRAIAAMGPEATIVVFSDHGEEFWEHGGFEHGHAFYDEVLRVPLVVRSPGLPPGRVDAPVSLLDLTPTLLELVGAPTETQGRSLVGLATDPASLTSAFALRPQAFGRPLYDGDGWGVLVDGSKWWSRHGGTVRYDLGTDPGETTSQIVEGDDERFSALAAEALEREVDRVWRFAFEVTRPWPDDVVVTVSHPNGIAGAELAYAPRAEDPIPPPVVRESQVELVIPARAEPPEALYVRPSDEQAGIRGLGLSIVADGLVHAARVTFDLRDRSPGERQQFLRIGKPQFQIAADLAWVPEPRGQAVEGFDASMKAQLEELGYIGD